MSSSELTTHTQRLAKGALWYASQGWKLLPCFGITDGGRCTCNGAHGEPKDVGKHPVIGEWNTRATDDSAQITQWWTTSPENNIGVYCQGSGFIVVDIDPRSGGMDSFDKFIEYLGQPLPDTATALTGKYTYQGQTFRGKHLYFKVPDGGSYLGNLKSLGMPGIDIKYNGYVMVSPSRHGSGVNYDWDQGLAPWEIGITDAPEFLINAITKKGRRNGTQLGTGEWEWLGDLDYDGDRIDIDKMITEGIDEGSRAVDIYRLTCAIANKMGVNSEAGRLAVETLMIRFNYERVRPPLELEGPGGLLMHVRRAIEFVSENPVSELLWAGAQEWANKITSEARDLYKPTPTVAAVPSQQEHQASYDNPVEVIDNRQTNETSTTYLATTALRKPENFPGTIGGAVTAAANDGISIAEAFSNGNIELPKDPDAISEAEGGSPGKRSLSDIGNGRRIVDSYSSSVKYTPGIGWFIWEGQYWKPDAENLNMQEFAKRLPTIISTEIANYDDADNDKKNEVLKWANQAKSNSRLNAAIESANSDPRIRATVENWDGDAYLLGVQNGVVDLRTGELLKGRPELNITKRAPVAYTPGMTSVRWQQFIDFATGGDKEYQDWLQRAVGYSLTGLRTQDIMFLVYGPPGSGKNTFVEAVVKAMGSSEYAWPLDSMILAQGDGAASSTDLYHWAELRGRRFVWVDELPESERLKENSVKKLTGSSTISARSPGEKPFSFESQAKLWVTTNHRPMINDDAMWRRIRPIPWSHVPEVSDPDLKAFLFDTQGGLPAVLSWAVEGAIKYLGSQARDPLGWCSVVKDAADIYRKNEDRMGMFLNEEMRESDGASVSLKSTYTTYRIWSDERGEKAMTQIAFTRKLSDRGLKIEGTGSRAIIRDYMEMPRAVPNGQNDWQNLTRIAGI